MDAIIQPVKRPASLISNKAITVITLVSFLTLLLTCAAFIIYEILSYQKNTLYDLTTSADMVSGISTAALIFKDDAGATSILSNFIAKPNVIDAAIYDQEGTVFAKFNRYDHSTIPPALALTTSYHQFVDDYLILYQPINMDGEMLGLLYIKASLKTILQQLQDIYGIAFIALLIALTVAFLLAKKFSKIITNPIENLALATKQVRQQRNYDIQVEKTSHDEIGLLTDDFNAMLHEIHVKDQSLKLINEQLESKIKQRTAALEIERNRALSADKAKTAFLANMSHEIRTPLTAILGFVDLLSDPETTQTKRIDFTSTIERNSKHLLSIINDILDISKIEAGEMQISLTEFSLLELLADIDSMMHAKAKAKNLQFDIECIGKIPEVISSDPIRLKQILVNLTSNAIKFTDKGSIRILVSLEMKPEDTLNKRLILKVIDTGIGMSEQQQQLIFQPFKQADASTTRLFGGTGLGLAISKQLTLMLEGDIDLESHIGFGSQFTVKLPIGSLQDVELIDNANDKIKMCDHFEDSDPYNVQINAHILLIEDGIDNQRLISYQLQRIGMTITIAENGLIGYNKALSAQHNNQAYDLILSDMQMPVMDGYTAVKKLRAEQYTGPIIAITAHALTGDKEQCIKAGCDDYITKPISPKKLRDMLVKYIDNEKIAMPNANTPPLTVLHAQYQEDDELLPLIHDFIDTMPKRLIKLEQAYANNNLKELHILLHQLKGCAGGYGFPDISTQAANIISIINNNDTEQTLTAQLEQFIKLCGTIQI